MRELYEHVVQVFYVVCLLTTRLGVQDKADMVCDVTILNNTAKKNAKIPEYLHKRCTLRHLFNTCCDIRSVPKKVIQ